MHGTTLISPPAAPPPPISALIKEPPPASPGGSSTLHGEGDPQEGTGVPLKEGVFKEGREHAHDVMRLCLKPCHSVFALSHACCYSWRLLWSRRVRTRPAPGYARLWEQRGRREIVVMGCRRGAGLGGGGTRCLQKTSVRVVCGTHIVLFSLQVCFLWQLRI